MVNGAELAVLGTLLGASVSGVITLISTKIKQDAETKRRYGEVFLQKRANRLSELYDSFAACENKLDRLKHSKTDSRFEFIEVDSKEVEEEIVDSFFYGDKAEIFLDESQVETLNNGLNGLISIYVVYSEDDESDDIDRFDDEEAARESIESAKSMLKSEINNPTDFQSK